MKEIKVKKCNEMIYSVSIDGKVYCYTGTLHNAEKIAKNLNFVYNVGR